MNYASGHELHRHHHLAKVLHPTPAMVKAELDEVEGRNAKLAVLITTLVGTMWCAYIFAILAFISLPDAIRGGKATLVSWIAQTFLQLVLLSIIMVGQRVQASASDARAAQAFADTETIMDRVDERTEHGIGTVMAEVISVRDRLAALGEKIDALAVPAPPPPPKAPPQPPRKRHR